MLRVRGGDVPLCSTDDEYWLTLSGSIGVVCSPTVPDWNTIRKMRMRDLRVFRFVYLSVVVSYVCLRREKQSNPNIMRGSMID